MKKVFSLVLCFVLVLGLTACGQSEQDKKFDELVRQASTSDCSDLETAAGSMSDPAELSANLVLRTYQSEVSLEIWEDYIREFNETYPNIHIEIKNYDISKVDGDT